MGFPRIHYHHRFLSNGRSEWQLFEGRKIIGRFDFEEQVKVARAKREGMPGLSETTAEQPETKP
jgi:hypothetical protein